jgi:hypothetical protein
VRVESIDIERAKHVHKLSITIGTSDCPAFLTYTCVRTTGQVGQEGE